ncbi:MFS-type efflux pump MFS1 [Pseudocercospora fuligena]|uniref:MFS-type efflux pump MFS1 n=1 Tax=Pseudocercospora fuligena TaxID=685502 RepID=A0A8H6VRN6_9PEZI|nr:MFS-type efflux pump MFS1 [Pseudocercospora fuligena]
MATIPASDPQLESGPKVAPEEKTTSRRPESVESLSSHGLEDFEKPRDEDVKERPSTEDSGDALARQKSAAPSEIEYPGTKETIIVMTAILLAVFLMALDRTIIATAIPSITDEFNSLDDIGWYGSAFMLCAASFQLLIGRIYTFHSPKWVFLTNITIFEVGSAICGAAPNSVAFIIGRAIAGLGSAGIMSGAVILMVSVVPLAKRPAYMGFFGAVFGVSSVIGPLLGGAFTTDVSWRWCFYINLPIGGVAMLVIAFILKPTVPAMPGLTFRQQLAKLDLLGELFLLPCIICLLLALQWGGATYAWSNWRIIVLFVFFGVTLVAFVIQQCLMQNVATIPARIVKNRSIIAGMWLVLCLASTMMVFVYYIPTWFQAVKGTTAVKSGIDTIPMVLALVIGSIFAGQMVGRIGYYTPFAMAASVVMPIGAGLITTWSPSSDSGYWIGYQVLIGLGLGLGMQQGSMAAQTVLSRKDVPTGVSLMFFMQQLGGAIFVSVGQNVFQSSLISGLVSQLPDLNPMTIVDTGATDIRKLVPEQDLPQVLVVYNHALRQVFIVGVILACLSCFGSFALEWRSVKGKQGPSAKNSNDNPPSTPEKAEESV